jgi:tetratricopeptide (TPR) repeat protein
MTIPLSFYLLFWLKNSTLALATGFVLVFFITPLFALVPWSVLIGFAIYQVLIYRYFFGNFRGDFEYAYREAKVERIIRKAIIKKYGIFVFLRYLSDRLGQIRTFNENFIFKLFQEKPQCVDGDLEFAIYMKLAEYALKNGDYEKERIYLGKAIENNPSNLVANFILAVALERSGAGTAAIEHYYSALQDPYTISDQLKKFIAMQISWVKTNGLRKKPAIPALRFLTW